MQFSLSVKAYYKVVLHCSRYPLQSVNGVFIGTQLGSRTTIIDAFPIAHAANSLHGLLPVVELALMHIDTLLSEQYSSDSSHGADSEPHIVGYYFANSSVDDYHVSSFHTRVLSRISANFPNAIGWLLDNRRISREGTLGRVGVRSFLTIRSRKVSVLPDAQMPKISFFGGGEGGEDQESVDSELVFRVCRNLPTRTIFSEQLVDFKSHLDDVQLDYRNQFVEKIREADVVGEEE